MLAVVPVFYITTTFIFANMNTAKPYVPSVITATRLYNVTYANLTYGANTTNIWGAKQLDSVDNTNASFIETLTVGVNSTLLGDAYTDATTGWIEEYRFKNIETVADGAIGTTSIRSQFSANNGEPILAFDNHTSYAMNLDTSQMDEFNVSVRGSAVGSVLHEILYHFNASRYYYVLFDQAITTTWVTLSTNRATAISIGGMNAADPINYINFVYTSPQANRWMYIDAPTFYNETYARRLSISFNFTGIAAYDHYALNVSAASNVTSEYMQISGNFDEDSVYDIEGPGTAWEDFLILLNPIPIVTNTYFSCFINSTLLSDPRNSTLDIDLFQVYAWNETNVFPVINQAICTNLDDVNVLYAGYRNYTFTLNVTDADGTADIHYARIGLEAEDNEYYWKAGFFEDNKTFVVEQYPGNITLHPAECSWAAAGNNLNMTFAIEIEIAHSSIYPLRLSTFVNDTEGKFAHFDYALGYRVEVNANVTDAVLSDDRGNGGVSLYCTGHAYYYNSSNIPLASDTYDIWVINLDGMANSSTVTISPLDGSFNVTTIVTAGWGYVDIYTYFIGAKGEGGNETDPCLCATNHNDTYIVDLVYVYFTRVIMDPSSAEIVYMRPVVTRVYDMTEVTNYDMALWRDGVVWKSFDETNFSANFWDTGSGVTHIYEPFFVIDNTYVTTDFDYTPMIVMWYSGHGDGGGGDDDDDDDAWIDWDDLRDFFDVDDDEELMWIILFIIMMLTLMGCMIFTCSEPRDVLYRIKNIGSIFEEPFHPFIPVLKKKDEEEENKKKKKRKK